MRVGVSAWDPGPALGCDLLRSYRDTGWNR
jgi:hypothetical protein